MSKSLLRKLFRGKGARQDQKAQLVFETLEIRAVPANIVWTGDAVPPPPGAPRANDMRWSNPNNWDLGRAPAAGDTVIFPPITGANKPPAAIVNNVFVFPDPQSPPIYPSANSIIDGNYTINDLIIQDDNYHLNNVPSPLGQGVQPVTVPATLTILGRIITEFNQPLGQLTGLSLIGPVSGPSTLTIQFDSASPGGTTFLQADGTGVLYITAPIIQTSNVNSIEKVGTGPIALAGTNTFTAGVAVTNGTLIAANSAALGDTVRGTTVANGATLAVSDDFNFVTINESLTITGNGVGGQGALRAIEDPFYIFRNGTGRVWSTNVTWSGGITISPSASIGADANNAGFAFLTVDGTGISGSGDLSKVGFGFLILTVGNTYAGQTLVRQGGLRVQNDLALSPTGVNVSPDGTTPGVTAGSSTTVFAGATLYFDDTRTINETLFINGGGLVDNVGRGVGAVSVVGFTTYNGTITLQSDASIGATTGSLLLINGLVNRPPNGLVYGAFDLSKVNEGNVRITTANPGYTGNTFVRNGTLEVADRDALGTGNTTVTVTATTGTQAAQGTLQLEGTYALPQSLVLNGTGFQTTGAVRVVGGTIAIPNGTTLAGPTSVAVEPATRLDFTGVIDGGLTATFTKTGTGTLSLQGDNTYLGATTFRAGLNIITTSTALGAVGGGDTTVFAGATLQLQNSLTVVDENLNIAGQGTAGQGALVSTGGTTVWGGLVNMLGIQATRADFSVLSGSLEFSNVISGDADFHKLGAGELRFTGSESNTYTTATYVDLGVLSLGKVPPAGAVGPLNAVGGQVFVGGPAGTGNNSAVLRLLGPSQLPELVSGTSIAVTVDETGLLDLNGFNETVGPLVLSGGEVTTGAGVLTLTTNVDTRLSAETAAITGSVSLNGVTRTFSARNGPALTFGASASPAQFGSTVDLTVTLSPSGPPVTGFVEFFDGTTSLGTAQVDQITGVASLPISTLAAGPHTITARYSGDANYSPRTVALPSTLNVVGAPSQQLLSSTANQTAPGNASFRFLVTRSNAAHPLPTGFVDFYATNVSTSVRTYLGTRTVDPTTGVATINAFFLTTPGAYVITAEYSGDTYYPASIVTLLGNQIIVDAPAVVVTSSANGSAVGQGVTFTFTATRSGTSPVPTGTVQFFDGTTLLGTTKTLVNGVAISDVINNLAAGTRVITAVYSGDALYEAQTVTLLGGQVVTNAPAFLLSANTNQVAAGQSVVLTFTAANAALTGPVRFFNGTALLGTAPLVNGVATLTTPLNPPTRGAQNIFALFGTSNVPLAPQLVVANPLSVQLSSTFNPAPTGATQSVTFIFTAETQPGDPAPTAPAGAPAGTAVVTFTNGGTTLGTATLQQVGFNLWEARLTVTGLGGGQQFIRAAYAGNASYPATTVELNPQEGILSPPTIRFNSSATTVGTNVPVAFTFRATPTGGAGAPTGTVSFFDGATLLGTAALNAAGVATYLHPGFGTQGTRTITAVYPGDTTYEAETVTLAPGLVVTNSPVPPTPTSLPALPSTLALNGNVFGSPGNGIVKDGSGVVTLGGPNAYTGPTQIVNGTLRLTSDNALPDTGLTITSTGILDVNGRADAVASLTGAAANPFTGAPGAQLLLGAGSLSVIGNASTTFSGSITSGPAGGLVKFGSGTLTLDGPSPGHNGVTIVAQGAVYVNASQPNADVEVLAGATFGGTGPVGGVTVRAGGTFTPGTAAAGSTTDLQANGNVSFAAGSTFVVNANGTTAGSGYDRVTVTGTATLGGATLVLPFGPNFNPSVTPPTSLGILRATSVVGDFGGLPDGTRFTVNNRVYEIDYIRNGANAGVYLNVVSILAAPAIASNNNPAAPNTPITFTFTLTPANTNDTRPTGQVTFFDGATQIGQVNLGGGATGPGTATLTVPSLSDGPHTIRAVYAGDANYATTEASLVQRVTVPSAATLSAQQGPVVFGDSAAFVVVVPRVGTRPAPSGTVTFVNAATGVALGQAALDANGGAAFGTTNLPPGTVRIVAQYSGDGFYRASTSNVVTQVVDRQNRVVLGSDAGPVATVQVFDSRTGGLLRTLTPFDAYRGGVKVATGDVNGDGVADVVVSAGAGAPGGHVRVFDGRSFDEIASFFTFIGYTGGVNVAVGDLDNDGFGDLVIGTAVANDHVKAFSGRALLSGAGIAANGTADPSTIQSFFAYSPSGGNPVGVTVGTGDVDGDGVTDIITGSATFAGHVKAFSGASNGLLIGSYFAYGAGYLGGIYVAGGDLDGDGRAEVITGATNAPHVKALKQDGTEVASFFAFTNADGSPSNLGVRVGAADRNGNRLADILVGAGSGAPAVKVFNGLSPDQLIESFLANPAGQAPSTSGVFVGGSGPRG